MRVSTTAPWGNILVMDLQRLHEVTLEVFLTAWRLLPQYRLETTLRTWLFSIACHHCQQAYRNRARRQAIVVTFANEIRACTQAEAPPLRAIVWSTSNCWHDSMRVSTSCARLSLPVFTSREAWNEAKC
jgi:DNA-directed RNA polymerase specialized sigma24 family protein